jgi:hypothetical protein
MQRFLLKDSNLVTDANSLVFYIPMSPPREKITMTDLMTALILPAVAGKAAILYFGGMYSDYPGNGYGIGLALSIFFTIFMAARFIWRYRGYKS